MSITFEPLGAELLVELEPALLELFVVLVFVLLLPHPATTSPAAATAANVKRALTARLLLCWV
jgi:hypothetical protein